MLIRCRKALLRALLPLHTLQGVTADVNRRHVVERRDATPAPALMGGQARAGKVGSRLCGGGRCTGPSCSNSVTATRWKPSFPGGFGTSCAVFLSESAPCAYEQQGALLQTFIHAQGPSWLCCRSNMTKRTLGVSTHSNQATRPVQGRHRKGTGGPW